MPLLIKICGLNTPESVDAALEAGADAVGFVFFPPSPRHLGFEAARALEGRVRDRALKVALAVNASDDWLAAVIEALRPDILQLHGKETRDRVVMVRTRFGLPVIKAWPIGCCSMPARRVPLPGRAALARASIGGFLRALIRAFHFSSRAALMPITLPRRFGSPRRPASMSPRALSARRARRTPTRFARLFGPPAMPPRLASARSRAAHDGAEQAQFLSHRSRRARAFRAVWRPLRRRDADAAHPRARRSLCAGEARRSLSQADGRLPRRLCGPAVAALFRRAPERASRRRQGLSQARGPQSHRRP